PRTPRFPPEVAPETPRERAARKAAEISNGLASRLETLGNIPASLSERWGVGRLRLGTGPPVHCRARVQPLTLGPRPRRAAPGRRGSLHLRARSRPAPSGIESRLPRERVARGPRPRRDR